MTSPRWMHFRSIARLHAPARAAAAVLSTCEMAWSPTGSFMGRLPRAAPASARYSKATSRDRRRMSVDDIAPAVAGACMHSVLSQRRALREARAQEGRLDGVASGDNTLAPGRRVINKAAMRAAVARDGATNDAR